MTIMITIEQLQKAINAIFGERPPNKALSSSKVREFVADYLNIQDTDISMEDLKAALRNTPFARPKAMLRGSSRLSWYFVGQPKTESVQPSSMPQKPVRKRKITREKENPLAESQRLKK
jgi:hypothetical protein